MMSDDLPSAVVVLFLVVWLIAFGGAIGSFLNVVIYRLPAGMSLIRPASHCPACRHPRALFELLGENW